MKVGISKEAAICAIILLFVSICSLNASASDLPVYSGWAKEEVSAAEDMRLLPFAMYDDCRRALHRDWAAAFLVRFVETVMNSPIESRGVQLFDDVPIGRPNFEDINKAYTIGVTKGVGDGTKFEPYRDITREEYATMLYRALDYIEHETGENILCNFNIGISFVDRDDIADWATEPIRILSSVGLFQGTAQKKIEPKNAISIEQAIVLSYRGMLLVQDKTQK